MRLCFSQHLAGVADRSIPRLNRILSLGSLNAFGPLDVERDIGKVSLLLLLGLRAAVNFHSRGFVSFLSGRYRKNRGVLQVILECLTLLFRYPDWLDLSFCVLFLFAWLKETCSSKVFSVVVDAFAAQLSNAFWNQVNIEVFLSYFT